MDEVYDEKFEFNEELFLWRVNQIKYLREIPQIMLITNEEYANLQYKIQRIAEQQQTEIKKALDKLQKSGASHDEVDEDGFFEKIKKSAKKIKFLNDLKITEDDVFERVKDLIEVEFDKYADTISK